MKNSKVQKLTSIGDSKMAATTDSPFKFPCLLYLELILPNFSTGECRFYVLYSNNLLKNRVLSRVGVAVNAMEQRYHYVPRKF